MNQERQMLIRNRDQFIHYAESHRAKVQGFVIEQSIYEEGATNWCLIQGKIDDTVQKAETNEQMAKDIQDLLNQPERMGPLGSTANFARIAYADGVSPKNQQTQMGVHFEEVAEMITSLTAHDKLTKELADAAYQALEDFGNHLKLAPPGVVTIAPEDRLEFLDAVCDQLVTATLSAVLHDMDPVSGLAEVNRSNYSKLVDGVMTKTPDTAKWIKGPDYTAPDLKPFI